MSDSRPPFVLLIAINQYRYVNKDYPQLTGSIKDANAVKGYVEGYLGLKETPSRIRTLYDSSATRRGIINELENLAKSEEIQKGDPIIIFYAGHGCEVPTPAGWESTGDFIQALAPHDFNENNLDTALPDRTIGALLEKIADKKGDNITVIFDCCHSGSMTRGDADATAVQARIRGLGKLKGTMSPQVDEEIWAHYVENLRGRGPAKGFLNSGLESHVLLSACGAKEGAKEYAQGGAPQGGAFTSALLKTLSTVGHNKVTYTELIHRLPELPGQNPQCEGYNRRRICFDSKAPVPKSAWFGIKTVTQNGRIFYEIDAGMAHGITEGAEFAVYSSQMPPKDEGPLAHVTASTVYPYRCIVKVGSGSLRTNLGQAKAVQTRVGTQEDLRLFIPKDGRENVHMKVIYDALEAAGEVQVDEASSTAPQIPPRIALAKKSKAELGVFLNGTDLMVEVFDPSITIHGMKLLQSPIPTQLPRTTFFLQAAAHYHRYLHRIHATNSFLDQIKIEFIQLKRQGLFYQPAGENLIKAGVVDLTAEDGVMYGIKIVNESDRDLFPNVFFFNVLDLSIDPVYECAVARAGKQDCPLPARGFLTIGYGAGGRRPFDFHLDDGQEIDVSLLKIFIADRYVDMGHVAQSSPFEPGEIPKRSWEGSPFPEGAWCTTVVSVVQHRPT